MRRHGLLPKQNRSPPVIDRRLLPSHNLAMRYTPPQPQYPLYPAPDQIQFGSPSSLSPVTSPMDEDYEHSSASDNGAEDDVIVIHEHHHHHHHNTDEDEEGFEKEQQDGDDTLLTTDELMDNIVNDKVLYDFVSFLLESQRSKDTDFHDKMSNDPVPVVPEMRYSEESPPLYREETERMVGTDFDDIEHFLEDGFEPIIEVELD